MARKCIINLIIILSIINTITFATAEIVNFKNCSEATSCTIHEVRVDPCKEAEAEEPCRIKRGDNPQVSFDFTPNFDGDLFSRPYWTGEAVEVPFLILNTDACGLTSCPSKSGQKQSYSVTLQISKKWPKRTYDIKWKLWNSKEQQCCFIFGMKFHD